MLDERAIGIATSCVDAAPRLRLLKSAQPPTRKADVEVGSVVELAAMLKDAGALR